MPDPENPKSENSFFYHSWMKGNDSWRFQPKGQKIPKEPGSSGFPENPDPNFFLANNLPLANTELTKNSQIGSAVLKKVDNKYT